VFHNIPLSGPPCKGPPSGPHGKPPRRRFPWNPWYPHWYPISTLVVTSTLITHPQQEMHYHTQYTYLDLTLMRILKFSKMKIAQMANAIM